MEQDVFSLPRQEDMPAGSKSFLRWLFFFAAPYKKTILFFTSLRLARYTVMSMLPFAIGRTINAFESGWAFEHQAQLVLSLAAFMAVYGAFLMMFFVFIRETYTEDRMIRGLTLFSVKHMNALPLSWHEAQGSGGKLQRIMTARNSLKQISRIYRWNLMPFIGAMFGIVLSVMLIEAPQWFILLYLGFMASYFGLAWVVAKPLPALHNRHNTVLEKLMSGVYEFVSAIRTVKAFHMGDYIESRAIDLEGQGHAAMKDVIKAIFIKWTILNTTGVFWLCVFVTVCVAGVFQGWLSVGAFATCFFLASNLWNTLDQMVYIQDEFIEARNGFLRLTETLQEQPQKLDLEPVCNLPESWRAITFENVGFSYPQQNKHALQRLDLQINRGEKIALVGKSGAGKSTLIKLLMKQVWPQQGEIRVDGMDLRHIESGQWLGAIGFVPQDVELFNMSVRDNILLDRIGEVSDSDYRQALEQSALLEFVSGLPEGDATLVGERGVKLSGGQRQRLGIARALVRRSELIIFDEATSSLDSLSEDAIRQAIDMSFAGRTLVLIAHRLSTVRHVDRILVLDDGKLIEEGSFDELLAKGGMFAKLWAMQSGHYDRL